MSETGSKTIQTAGKFCEDDILLEYQKTNTNITVVNIPTVTVGTYTYNGSAQGPTISNYNENNIRVSNATQTNAGNYTLTLSLANAQTMVWSDNTTADKTYEYTINKLSITPPTVSGNYNYNGNQQSPSISYASGTSGFIVVSGDTSAINTGTYTLTFSLNNISNTQWSDGTVSKKYNNWSINKATPTFTLSSNSVTLNYAFNRTVTVTLTYNGDGEVSVSSSDTSIANVNYSNNNIIISSVDYTVGTATITVSATAGTNYNAPSSKSISVTAESTVYGASWDGTSTTAWTRTGAAANFSDPVPYVSGASNYGSPFDNIMPWSGMVKSTRTAGVMVAIPKFYYKIIQNGSGMQIYITSDYVDGFSVSPAHMKRGSETVDRDVVYIGRYHGASDYKSTSGVKPKTDINCSTAAYAIHRLGSNIWQMDFAMRFTIWLLYIVEFANWNSQAKIGYGCGNNSSTGNMGYTDSMPYHTGTTQSSRTTYGLGTQYRNIEGLWDNVLDWMGGCYYGSNGLNITMVPSQYVPSYNGISIGIPSSGSPSAFSVKNVSGTFPTFIPSASNGSDSTYSCDYWGFNSSGPCLSTGGSYAQYSYRGLFCVSCDNSGYSSSTVGFRCMELP